MRKLPRTKVVEQVEDSKGVWWNRLKCGHWERSGYRTTGRPVVCLTCTQRVEPSTPILPERETA